MIPSVVTGVGLRDLERIRSITRKAFPSVPQANTDMLAGWMEQGEASLLLVDVRAPHEFAVSHLRGAMNLQSAGQIAEAVKKKKPAKTILYCSVGFRSSRLAHLLAQQGWRDIFNLEGSIFQWANDGRPVYRGDLQVQQVHPYGKRWAGLIKDGLASDC